MNFEGNVFFVLAHVTKQREARECRLGSGETLDLVNIKIEKETE